MEVSFANINTLQTVKRKEELKECNQISEKFGLSLSEQQMEWLMQNRYESLKSTGRIEFGEGMIRIENIFLSCFEKEAMRAVLIRYCPDYRGLLINLYAPIVTNAIGCALQNKGFHELICSEKEQQALTALFDNLTGEEITDCIRSGAVSVLKQISCDNRREEELIERYGRELAVRIAGVKDVGGIAGIFL